MTEPDPPNQSARPGPAPSIRWRGIPLALVVTLLIASVVFPARETWRIMNFLEESADIIEPARRLAVRLDSGLTTETSALEAYAVSGDPTELARYRAAARDDDERLAAIDSLARELGPVAVEHAETLRQRLEEWRHAASPEGTLDLRSTLDERQLTSTALLDQVAQLSAYLAVEGDERRAEVRDAERTSFAINASLILVALSAVFMVGALSRRERLLTISLQNLLDEAREGREMLERAISSRSRLMRGFSHDVKNPLGAADGYASMLLDGIFGDVSSSQRDSIVRVRRLIHTALHLIDDLHELARAETGHVVLATEPSDLAALARDCADEYRAEAEAHGLDLLTEIDLDPIVVVTDAARVEQILSNLLSNAIKYTSKGSISIVTHPAMKASEIGDEALAATLATADSAGEGGNGAARWAGIEVRDTGSGIPEDKFEAVFEEFTRLDASRAPGSGLGLAISDRVARALGGRITIRSEVGVGSAFTLWLPVREKPVAAAGAEDQA